MATRKKSDSAATLANLYEIYAKLDKVDAIKLEDDEYKAWSKQHAQVRLAIMALEAKSFEDLAAKQQDKAPDLVIAIGNLEESLHGLQDDAKVVKTVGAGLRVVTSLVTLLA